MKLYIQSLMAFDARNEIWQFLIVTSQLKLVKTGVSVNENGIGKFTLLQ